MGSQPKKLGIIAPKAGKTQKMVKSLVNPNMHDQGPPEDGMSKKPNGSSIGSSKIQNRGFHRVPSGCWTPH